MRCLTDLVTLLSPNRISNPQAPRFTATRPSSARGWRTLSRAGGGRSSSSPVSSQGLSQGWRAGGGGFVHVAAAGRAPAGCRSAGTPSLLLLAWFGNRTHCTTHGTKTRPHFPPRSQDLAGRAPPRGGARQRPQEHQGAGGGWRLIARGGGGRDEWSAVDLAGARTTTVSTTFSTNRPPSPPPPLTNQNRSTTSTWCWSTGPRRGCRAATSRRESGRRTTASRWLTPGGCLVSFLCGVGGCRGSKGGRGVP